MLVQEFLFSTVPYFVWKCKNKVGQCRFKFIIVILLSLWTPLPATSVLNSTLKQLDTVYHCALCIIALHKYCTHWSLSKLSVYYHYHYRLNPYHPKCCLNISHHSLEFKAAVQQSRGQDWLTLNTQWLHTNLRMSASRLKGPGIQPSTFQLLENHSTSWATAAPTWHHIIIRLQRLNTTANNNTVTIGLIYAAVYHFYQ